MFLVINLVYVSATISHSSILLYLRPEEGQCIRQEYRPDKSLSEVGITEPRTVPPFSCLHAFHTLASHHMQEECLTFHDRQLTNATPFTTSSYRQEFCVIHSLEQVDEQVYTTLKGGNGKLLCTLHCPLPPHSCQ